MFFARPATLFRIAIVGLAVPILLYCLLGVFSRLMADDYCYASIPIEYGFLGSIDHYYQRWFGRLTQIVAGGAAMLIGVPFAQVFPAVLVIVWLLALWWLVNEMKHVNSAANANENQDENKNGQRLYPLIIAALILYATLAGTPQIHHSLYWISAVFPFMFPLVLLTLFCALTLRSSYQRSTVWMLVCAGVLSFAAGASSEPYAVMQIVLFGGLLFVFRQSRARKLLSVGLITAIIALVIMVLAPGNTYRQSLFVPTHDLLPLATQSLLYAAGFIAASAAYFSPGAVIAALFLPSLLNTGETPRYKLSRWLILLVGFGLIVVFNLPVIYATSVPPPARTYSMAQFAFVCTLVLFSTTLHIRVSPRVRVSLVIAVLVIAPLLTSVKLVQLVPTLAQYAAEWDAREALIRNAEPGSQVVIAPLEVDLATRTGLEDLMNDPAYWINECAAIYYGIESIRVSAE